ncbi:hypothetical protein H8S61_08170 [Eggerthella sp. NSJ-70]|uniref:DUF4179 domain-containing protein n=1 Tax=Eggerthella hominis TaxID=2763043 RepID=A0ABR7BRD6_9ACTN|nr:hypothetical protein [Eggerthella hominis]MBC5584168.1 hypothetical protein [Eggerthella hominis]
MTDDPLTRYAALMNRAHAPRDLSRAVLDRIERQQSEQTRPTGPRHQAAETGPAPATFSVKRHRFRGFAIAACLLLLASIVGLSLALPHFAKHGQPFGFAINAYGASGNSLLAMGEDGRILFEADILFRVPPDDRYADEGVYTGCMFRIEGTDIVRVQAHIDKGELYRYTYDEFTSGTSPDRWAEALEWNTTLIGEGAFFSAYDLVQPISSPTEGEQPDSESVGVKCYQRLGSTIDLPVTDEAGSRLSDYCFGLWTNENAGVVTGYQDYIDTLDGATLTITIEKADGTHATKTIELTAADVKAKLVPSETNATPELELIPQIVDPFEGGVQEMLNKRNEGFTWIHTLYGTVVEETCEPFPFADEQLPSLDRPLTEPAAEPSVEEASAEPEEEVTPEDSWVVCKNPLRLGETIDVRFPTNVTDDQQASSGSTEGLLTCTNGTASTQLPEGVTAADLASLHQAPFGELHIEEDGSISEGFAYATIDVTVKNTSDKLLYADTAQGWFGTIKELDGEQFFAQSKSSWPLWASGIEHPTNSWNGSSFFMPIQPGETKTFTVLHVVAVDELADPTFSYHYRNTSYGGRTTATYRIGSLELP